MEFAAETFIARCLMDPRYLESLREASQGTVDPSDLERLRLFGGFITKIQHNDLWEHFPTTRRLLHDFGLELPFFADYRAASFAAGQSKLEPRQKVGAFAGFLENQILSRPAWRCPGLLEVLRHERHLWELSFETTTERVADCVKQLESLQWKRFLNLIPIFPNPFRMAAFDRDPTAFAATPGNGGRRSRRVVLGYRKMPDGSRRVLTLDRISAAILSAVNGRRQVRTVIARAREAGLRAAQPRQFRNFLEQAAQAEIIAFLLRLENAPEPKR